MIRKIDHIMFYSLDLETTKNWYTEKLGFSLSYHAPGEFLSLQNEKMGRIDFHETTDITQVGKGAMPYFMVEDIDKTISWLTSKGIAVEEVQQEGDSPKHTWFYDCNNNVLGLEER